VQAEQERLAHERATSQPPDPDAMPAEPNLALKRTLTGFLAATSGVDYAAATQDRSGRKVFVNAAYESKPSPWKMCFRAGREACEAARSEASSWLRELKYGQSRVGGASVSVMAQTRAVPSCEAE
jgi:hypothetical protein